MPITKAVIDVLENCKVIMLGSVGVDSVDVAAIVRGIPVTNIPEIFLEEVAVAAMMLLCRLPPAGRTGQDLPGRAAGPKAAPLC